MKNRMQSITILTLIPEWTDESGAIHPVLLQDEQHLVLVDCGYTGFLPQLERTLGEHGLTIDDLTDVFLTHHDHDHVGTLAALKRSNPRIQVVAGKSEVDYISGRKPALRLTQARAMQATLPPERAASGQAFIKMIERVEPATVDLAVDGGDLLTWCGGCEVLATPGHTLGHVSLYVKSCDTLLAGDAAVLSSGVLALANPEFAEDIEKAQQSLHQICEHRARTVICYHGGVLTR